MKLLFALLFALFVVLVAAAPAVPQDEKKPLVVHGKQKRWMANDLKAYHQQMRKTHKNYTPYYPRALIPTTISLGTPAVEYLVSMESGSEALFVLAQDYPGRLANQPFFDPAQSSTARLVGGYNAFSGELRVFGSAYDDVVGLFGLGDPYRTTQRFGVVNDVDDPYFVAPQMPDGVVGLSWNPADAANPDENSSAILNLFTMFSDLDRYWCQWLGEIDDPVYGREYGVSTNFGGCLDDLCDVATPDNTLPLVWLEETRSLAFRVDAFTYKSQPFDGGFGKVDTGVPNILLPNDPFLTIINDTKAAYHYEYNLFVVDCSLAGSLPDWTFTIGGQQFVVRSSDYVVDLLLPDGQCVLSALNSDWLAVDYVLGYVFHQLWCIKMDIDNQTISFINVISQVRKAE